MPGTTNASLVVKIENFYSNKKTITKNNENNFHLNDSFELHDYSPCYGQRDPTSYSS
jgi:hypothetical protein